MSKAWPKLWIDAHCHLSDLRLHASLDQMLCDAKRFGISAWIQGGVDPLDWQRQLELGARHPGIIPSFGLHPWWIATQSESAIQVGLDSLRSNIGKARAVGELGLDYGSKFKGSEALQIRAFSSQLDLALDVQKPVVLHVVRAHAQAISILEERQKNGYNGIVHSFSGSERDANRYIELGFVISVSGSISHKGREKLQALVKKLPAEKLVVETDAPDQTPVYEGAVSQSLNHLSNLVIIAKQIGELRETAYESILDQSRETLVQVFGEIK